MLFRRVDKVKADDVKLSGLISFLEEHLDCNDLYHYMKSNDINSFKVVYDVYSSSGLQIYL